MVDQPPLPELHDYVSAIDLHATTEGLWRAIVAFAIDRTIERAQQEGWSTEEAEEHFSSGLEAIVAEWPKVVADTTNEAADGIHDDLLRAAPALIRAERRQQRAFEHRLYQRWGRALDLYYATFHACREAGSDHNDRVRGIGEPTGARFEALCSVHARACTTASEIHALLRTGHASGAQARWRTLHELAVIASVLQEEDDELAERFLLHVHVDDWYDAHVYQEHAATLGYEPLDAAELDEIDRAYDAVRARYGSDYCKPWGWALPLFPGDGRVTFDKLARRADLGHNRPFFRLASHGTHAGAKGLWLNRITDRDGRVVLTAGPSNSGLADPGQTALIALLQTTLSFLNSSDAPTLHLILSMKALDRLVATACQAFAEVVDPIDELEQADNPTSGRSSASE